MLPPLCSQLCNTWDAYQYLYIDGGLTNATYSNAQIIEYNKLQFMGYTSILMLVFALDAFVFVSMVKHLIDKNFCEATCNLCLVLILCTFIVTSILQGSHAISLCENTYKQMMQLFHCVDVLKMIDVWEKSNQ